MRLVFRGSEVNFEELEAKFELPKGYVLSVIAHHADGLGVTGIKLGYTIAVQLINAKRGTMSRGTGSSIIEALEDAISNVKIRGL